MKRWDYLKIYQVISLLEQFGCPDLVLTVAETGLAVAPQVLLQFVTT